MFVNSGSSLDLQKLFWSQGEEGNPWLWCRKKENRKDGDGEIEQQRHKHDNDHRGTHTKRERKSCEGTHLPRLFHLFCSRLSSNLKLSHLHLIHFKYIFYFNIHCSSITSHPFFASLTILFVGELGYSQDKGPLAVNPRALLLGMPRSEGCSWNKGPTVGGVEETLILGMPQSKGCSWNKGPTVGGVEGTLILGMPQSKGCSWNKGPL